MATTDKPIVDYQCPYCPGWHTVERCPRVKAIEYYSNGITIKRVEFNEPVQPTTITLEDLFQVIMDGN